METEEKTDMQVLIDALETIGAQFTYDRKGFKSIDLTFDCDTNGEGIRFKFGPEEEYFCSDIMVSGSDVATSERAPFTVTPDGTIKDVNVEQLEDGSWEASLPLDRKRKEIFKVKGKTEDIALMRFKNELTTAIINSLEEATLSK